jgi:hypothetical protein
MIITKYTEEAPDGLIRCTYVDIHNFRLLIAISESNWYTKGKKRLIPIWINKKGFFAYRLAIKLGFNKSQ